MFVLTKNKINNLLFIKGFEDSKGTFAKVPLVGLGAKPHHTSIGLGATPHYNQIMAKLHYTTNKIA